MSHHILLIATKINGLTRRVRLDLEGQGYRVSAVEVADAEDMHHAISVHSPDVVLAPFLKAIIPDDVIARVPRIAILHPGAPHDRGPSSLDHDILTGRSQGGVSMIVPTHIPDGGPLIDFEVVDYVPDTTKSTRYSSEITDAAVKVARRGVAKMLTPGFVPTPLSDAPYPVPGAGERPAMRRTDRIIDWSTSVEAVLRVIRAADGSPGALTELGGHPLRVYDAHPGRSQAVGAEPGTMISRRHHAIEVATGDGSVWIGHARDIADTGLSCKGPTAAVLKRAGVSVRSLPVEAVPTWTDIRYDRDGEVGVVTAQFYNGAVTVSQANRLQAALEHAALQDTRVLVLRGRPGTFFCTGLHLGEIQIATDPRLQAWRNITAINRPCKTLMGIRHQLTFTVAANSLAAGGFGLARCAHLVGVSESSMLNLSYRSMGLTGSELSSVWQTARLDPEDAAALMSEGHGPVGAAQAWQRNLVDHVLPTDDFDEHALELAHAYAAPPRWDGELALALAQREEDLAELPIDAWETRELREMVDDIFGNRFGFLQRLAEFHGLPEPAVPTGVPLLTVAS